jgi:hypothetical protein
MALLTGQVQARVARPRGPEREAGAAQGEEDAGQLRVTRVGGGVERRAAIRGHRRPQQLRRGGVPEERSGDVGSAAAGAGELEGGAAVGRRLQQDSPAAGTQQRLRHAQVAGGTRCVQRRETAGRRSGALQQQRVGTARGGGNGGEEGCNDCIMALGAGKEQGGTAVTSSDGSAGAATGWKEQGDDLEVAVLAGEVEASSVVVRGGKHELLAACGDEDADDLQMASRGGGVKCRESVIDSTPVEKCGATHFRKVTHDFGVALVACCMQARAAVGHVNH